MGVCSFGTSDVVPVFGQVVKAFYGSRHLRRESVTAGRHRIRRLMRLMGMEATCRRPRTSVASPEHRVFPYLLRGLTISRADHVWCADITYVPVTQGFFYLVAVMDWATRHVLAWRLSNTMDASFCVEALDDATQPAQRRLRASGDLRVAVPSVLPSGTSPDGKAEVIFKPGSKESVQTGQLGTPAVPGQTRSPRAQARSPRVFETIGIHLNIALGLSNEVGPPHSVARLPGGVSSGGLHPGMGMGRGILASWARVSGVARTTLSAFGSTEVDEGREAGRVVRCIDWQCASW